MSWKIINVDFGNFMFPSYFLPEATMNRIVIFLLSVVLLGWAMPAWGAQRSPDYEHLKPLEWQIGDWETEFQATSDSGPIKKGDTVKARFSVHWSPDRSFMVTNSSWHVRGKRVNIGLEVIAWNDEKSIVSHSYIGTFGTGHGVWTKIGDTPELEWTIEGRYGTFAGTSYAAKGADSWEWQIRKQTHDGVKMPDMPLATFRRKVGAPAGDLWNAYQKAATGTWVGKGELLWDLPRYQRSKDDPFTLQLSLQEEMQGVVLAGDQVFEMPNPPLRLSAHISAAWDPDARQVRLFAFWSDGFVEELFFSRREGNKFFGTYTAKPPGSPKDRWPICLQFSDPDSYQYKFLGGPHKGRVLSSWKRQQ